MDKNILFIHSKQDEIKTFRGALKDTPFVVDAADNGIDAMEYLKKKSYAVVITNRILDGIDGGAIINYVFQYCPDTYCILNAITLNRGDIKYFLNQRHVYRIFLAPVDYKTQMLPVIEQAMIDYEIHFVNLSEAQMKHEQMEQQEVALKASRHIISQHKNRWKLVQNASVNLASLSLKYSIGAFSEEQKQRICFFEDNILTHLSYLMESNDMTLEKFEEMMCQRMNPKDEQRNFSLVCLDEDLKKASQEYFMKVYFMTWIVTYRMALLTDSCIVRTELRLLDNHKSKVSVICYLPKGTWKKHNEDMAEKSISAVVVNVLEEVAEDCVTVVDEYQAIYHMKLSI